MVFINILFSLVRKDVYKRQDMGRIRSLDQKVRGVCHFTGKEFYRNVNGRVLRPGQFCKSGHVSVVLGRGTPGRPVHQLVMLTFVGAPPDGMEVLHSNGDPTDNRLENLRYGTRTENILDVYRPVSYTHLFPCRPPRNSGCLSDGPTFQSPGAMYFSPPGEVQSPGRG